MRTLMFGLLLVFALALMPPLSAQEDEQPAVTAETPKTVPNFRLIDHAGRSHELHEYGVDSKAIVLYSQAVGCPINRRNYPVLQKLRDQYADQGVVFFMVNATIHDERPDLAAEAAEFEVDIPILKDRTQLILYSLGVERTCEAILIDPETWEIVYRGALDDRQDYRGKKEEADNPWLVNALDAFLAGEPVEVSRTQAKGCLIHYEDLPESVSYTDHVVPILENHCVSCHSPDNIGPFPMTSHRRVKGWSRMMMENILTGRMPPWHADSEVRKYANDRSLSNEQIRTLFAWFGQGAPKDGDEDPLREVENIEIADWPLGQPDLIVPVSETQLIPAEGVFDYRYIDVPSGLKEDKWVRAAVVRTNNRKVTHHVLVFLQYPPELQHAQHDPEGGLDGFFAGYVPGQGGGAFPEGTAKFLPADTTFIFQLHYNATGKPESERSELGLYFADGPPRTELLTRAASNTDFSIAPGDPDSETSASHHIDRDAYIYGMSPHMHLRGGRFAYEAHYPDGTTETLLSVPDYNFDWQTMYALDPPLRVPAGTRIVATGAFDNSVRNPYNPDPDDWVYFGEQTQDEMFIGYINYAYDPESDNFEPPVGRSEPKSGDYAVVHTGVPLTAETLVDTKWRNRRYRFYFEPDGVLTVNDSVKGTWRVEGDEVIIEVGGGVHDIPIDGDVLIGRGDRPMLRLVE